MTYLDIQPLWQPFSAKKQWLTVSPMNSWMRPIIVAKLLKSANTHKMAEANRAFAHYRW